MTVNNWATGGGGFIDNGVGTRWRNIYDADLASFIYPHKARTAIPTSASPFVHQNTSPVVEKIRVYGGVVTQVTVSRNGDTWIEQNPVAAGGGVATTGIYIILPGEQITVSYSAAPVINKIPMSAF